MEERVQHTQERLFQLGHVGHFAAVLELVDAGDLATGQLTLPEAGLVEQVVFVVFAAHRRHEPITVGLLAGLLGADLAVRADGLVPGRVAAALTALAVGPSGVDEIGVT